MKKLCLSLALLSLCGCVLPTSSRTTTVISTGGMGLSPEAASYSLVVRESLRALSRKNLNDYRQQFHPDSELLKNVQSEFDRLTRDDTEHVMLGAELLSENPETAEEIQLNIQISRITSRSNGSSTEIQSYRYTLKKHDGDWKILALAELPPGSGAPRLTTGSSTGAGR